MRYASVCVGALLYDESHCVSGAARRRSSGRLRHQRAHGYEVVVRHGSDVGRPESNQSLRPSRRRHELDHEGTGLVDLDDRTEIPSAQTVRRQVALENDDVEQVGVQFRSPGYAVTNRGTFSPLRTNQTLTTRAATPFGPRRIARIMNG